MVVVEVYVEVEARKDFNLRDKFKFDSVYLFLCNFEQFFIELAGVIS